MCKKFLKLNLESDEADFLALRHPNAFILLYFIAKRARRVSGLADGLVIGQCHIGDYRSYGLTEREYRTAKSVLCKRLLIKISETCRTRKKSTTGTTTVGTLVQLLDSRIWDINPDTNDDRNDDRATTERRPSDEEEEGIRRNKKEEENKNIAQSAKKRPRSKDSLSFDFQEWKFTGVTEADLEDWKRMYPSIALDVEILKAAHWLKDNPSKSNKTLWRKYLTGWFKRANEWTENKKAYQNAKPASSDVDRRTKDGDGKPVENQYAGRF